MTAQSSRRIELFRGLGGLKRLKPFWAILDKKNPDAPFFTRLAWHSAWLAILEPNAEDIVFATLWQQEELAGIIPLHCGSENPKRRQPRVLEIPRRAGMDLSAPIMAPGQQLAEWWPLLRAALKEIGYPAFIVKMTGALLDPILQRPLDNMGKRKIVRIQSHACWFDCQQDSARIRSGYSTRLKKILRRGRRKLESDGELEFRSWYGTEAQTEAYPIFLQLEASGWKAASGTALTLDKQARHFHEAFLFNPDSAGTTRINLLFAGTTPVAAQLCVQQGKTISLLKIAYAQERAYASPGSLLLDQLLQQCCADSGIDTVSLITGQQWMSDWGTNTTDVADIWLFDQAMSAQLVRGAAGLRDRLRQFRARA